MPGPHAVVSADVSIPASGGAVGATVYRPMTGGGYPLVVVSPGFQMPRAQYASYGEHLAGWGFVVIAQDFPSGFGVSHQALADQTRDVIDWALSAASGLAGAIDAARVGACGHSLGGKISLLAAADDARIGAVVGWDPVDANSPSVAPERMADVAGPVAVLGETLNGSGGFMPCAPAAENFQQYFTAAAAPALEVTVNGADHMDWVDDPSCGLCGFCTPAGTIGEDAVHRVTRRVTVAWFGRHLLGDPAMDAYLGGAGLAADLPGGALSTRVK
jgi:predicted dienelactone hydrolase